MNNEQYNKNSTLSDPHISPENHSEQMMFKNGFMDDFYADETEQNTDNKLVLKNNLIQGIIIASMPDLGDCKPIPNGTPQNQQHYYADNKSTTKNNLLNPILNFTAKLFESAANKLRNNNVENAHNITHSEQFVRSNIPFSRLIVIGIVILFCGVGLIVQNQINKPKNNDSQFIVTKNNSTTEPNINDKIENTSGNIASANTTTEIENAQKQSESDTNLTSKNEPNTTQIDSQNPNAITKSTTNTNTKPNQTIKKSIWDRPVTDNYSPWMKSGQISFDDKPDTTNDPNTSANKTENQNSIIAQTSAYQVSSQKISTPYATNTNPNLQPNTSSTISSKRDSYHYGTNNSYSNVNSYSTTTTERAAPPPYVNSKPITILTQFHAPVVTGQPQGRISVAETPATYRNFYGNHNDPRTARNISQPPNYSYPNQPIGTITHNPPPLVASAYPTTQYSNPTHQQQPTPTYTNPNHTYPTNNYYQNTAYPNAAYPNGTYSGGVYPNHALPRTNY
ncbi:MAG: hypothetical protein LBH59_00825 [Planctomycetaceae bacterium]|jgi:hypothetical protein|nr:hypothetical protein [Planctomycetaceae bacterium]